MNANDFPAFHFETEKLMAKANTLATEYAMAFDAICDSKPGADRNATDAGNRLRRAIRSALTGAYLKGCAETAGEMKRK